MQRLADAQAAVAKAMITGDSRFAPESLVGGPDPRARFAIHLRHYLASLQTALHDKFPATEWLLGDDLFRAAATAYIREHPPRTPCIAEYGSELPSFIAGFEHTARFRYVEAFARLEWLLGRASIALHATPLAWHELAAAGPDLLLHARLELQPGLGYLRAAHAVDTLMQLYLRDEEPETFEIPAGDARIEVGGARGSIRMTRLAPGTFAFRDALRDGESISDAAGRALDIDERFDPGQALQELVASGHVTSFNL